MTTCILLIEDDPRLAAMVPDYLGTPPVEVKVRAREHVAEILVCDHGTGVPNARRERVFEPFYRYATSSDTAGAGLGLALVRQIARRHGGEAYAEGNCFRVVLRR